MRLFAAGIGLLSAMAILQPVNAAEIPAKPKIGFDLDSLGKAPY